MNEPFTREPRPVSAADRTNVAVAARGRKSPGAAGVIDDPRDVLQGVAHHPPSLRVLVVLLSTQRARREGGEGPDAVLEDPLRRRGEGQRAGRGAHPEGHQERLRGDDLQDVAEHE
jgi:hypothetical protein